ncbi:MAG: acyl-CoA transferase [Rhodobacter sp.]|nr:acyl-CoA transferase [Rhodobacter sp.]
MAAAGLLILRDGGPGEAEVTLSPLCSHCQHRAKIDAVVQGEARSAQQMQGSGGPLQAANARGAAFGSLCASIGAALAADRTLGGLCDRVEAEAPRPVDPAVEGAASLKAAVIPVIRHCSAADPLA